MRRSLQTLLASPGKIGEQQARDWLAELSPWRALLAAHLWAALSAGTPGATSSNTKGSP